MSGRFDAVLFDLDGTLADTLEDIAAALNHALAEHGLLTHPPEQIRQWVGEGAGRLVQRAVPVDRPELAAPVLAAFRTHYGEHPLTLTRPYPGIPDLLARLLGAGSRLAVLSNKPDAPTRRIVNALFPGRLFDLIQGERPGVPRKPDPRAATAIAASLSVPPARCAFVGDTAIDVRTAHAAGMFACGVTWGFRGYGELHDARADAIVRDARELAAILLAKA